MSATRSGAFGGSVIWIIWLLSLVVSARDATTSQLVSTRVLETKKTSTRALRTYIKKSEIKKRHRGLVTVLDTSPSDAAKRRLEDQTVIDFVSRRTQSNGAAQGDVSRELGLGEQRGSRRKRIFYGIGGKGSSGKGGKGKGGEWNGDEGKSGKGKGGGKGKKEMKSSKGKGKGKKGKGISKICKELDFGGGKGKGKGKGKGIGSKSKGKGENSGKGKGKGKASKSKGKGKGESYGDDGYGDDGYSSYDDEHRQLAPNRSLQFDGELCDPNALSIASMNPDLSIFVDLLKHANLDEIFSCAGPFTVLAPSNAAFNKNPELLQSLFNPRNIEAVQELLLYQILPGLTLTDDFVAGPIGTLLGEDVDVSLEPLLFNNAGVLMGDILSCNGVIHIIDNLLIPPGSIILPEICEILDFREEGQFPALSRFNTLFHRSLDLIGAETQGSRRLQYQGARCDPNVLDAARDNPDLSTFVSLIEAAGLQDIFLCAGPFTVLAPTNEAFAALDPALVDELLLPENQELLQEVLLYHILPGFQPSSDLVAGPAETLLYNFTVDVSLNPVMFNDANVVMPDIMACNGIIHTIDDILTPMDENFCDAFTFTNRRRLQDSGQNCTNNVLDVAREDPNLTTVVALLEAADLADIFSCPGPFTALLPNNAAFDALDPAMVEFLLDPANQSELQDLLLYHILPDATLTTEFADGPVDTLLADRTIDVTTSPIMFNDAGVVDSDIEACNGLIDVIDTVLDPFPAQPTISPTTSPTPVDICVDFTFPIVRVRKLQNGGQGCDGNILEVAMRNADLSVVTTLIELAGLTDIFSCAGPFTALLPTNTAFDDVDQDLLDTLILPQNLDDLQRFLLYHILPGATLSDDFTAGPIETLASGNEVDVTLGPLQFDGRDVLETDIVACNGYIDILDGVLNIFETPTEAPTTAPTIAPAVDPTIAPTVTTEEPSFAPSAATVTDVPTLTPVVGPTTDAPTGVPTATPTVSPTATPTVSPTAAPTGTPTIAPTGIPIVAPTSPAPSVGPTAVPSDSPSIAPIPLNPTPTPVQTVLVNDYYISFLAPGATREPTQAEYDEMLTRINDWFEMQFTAQYANRTDVQFLGTETSNDFTLYGLNNNIPPRPAEFNIYMNFDFSAFTFSETSVAPTTQEIFEIMRLSITRDFILQVVRTFTGSPFESTVEVFFAASQFAMPP